ncbi:hypothetical protein [Nannocystis pusilla]|uniref:hypothetical protein n=1 Tax=Nannocystis pusilla TaxID=889268 RepID=UPI003B7FF3C6
MRGTSDRRSDVPHHWPGAGGDCSAARHRRRLDVPPGVTSFSYDFAFLSLQYPDYYQSAFNDT